MKLWELPSSKNNTNENPAQTALVLNEMRLYCPILEAAEFYQIVGSADAPRKASGSSGGKLRSLDGNWPDNKASIETGSIALAIFGDKIQVDRAYERRGQDIPSIMLRELKQWAKTAGQNLQYQIITGTAADANSFNGLVQSCPSSRQLSHAYAVNTEALVRDLVEKIYYGIDETPGANFILMDSQLKTAISKYADKIISSFTNELGRQVQSIADVPIIVAGKNSAGTRAFNWNPNSSSSTTSIIIGYSAESAGIAFASNVGLEVKDHGLVENHYTTSMELDVDMEVLADDSIYMITGIKGA